MYKSSRISRYQTSIEKFSFEGTNSPFAQDSLTDKDYIDIIKKSFKNSDKYLSILFLTVLNNQNKKQNISIQGYSAACGIEVIYLLFKMHDNKEQLFKKHGDIINKIIFKLSFSWITSIKINLETLKRKVNAKQYAKFSTAILGLITKDIPYFIDRQSLNNKIIFQKNTKKSDLPDYFLKQKPDVLKKFKNIKLVDKEFIKKTIMDTTCNIGELSCALGWLFGTGSEKKIDTVKQFGRTFSVLYILSKDFENLEEDIYDAYQSDRKFTYNYVVNCGFEKSYEMFNDYKNIFISEATKLDLHTGTVKEMIESIDERVDNILNNTSPDIKSIMTATTIQTIG